MLSFLKKKQPKTEANMVSGGDDLKQITESLYKQNLEIALKNKILSLLGKLYEISILTLDPKELAKRVSSTIQGDFSFELVGIFLFDEAKDTITPLAFSESERFKNIQSQFNIDLESIGITNVSKIALLKTVIKDKTMQYTEKFSDIWKSIVPKEMSSKMQSEGHIRSSLIYPIIIEEKVAGIFVISINRIYGDLINYEKESIKNFVNVISIALDKALLYEKLKITNEKLEDANAGQKTLIHVMNHQIKGFLGINKDIFAELLTDDYGQVPEAAKPLLKKGLEESDAGVQYVTQILRGASAESGAIIYDMHELDLKELLEKAYSEKLDAAKKKGLIADLKIANGDYKINADEKNLFEALKNLIDNSINYTLKGNIWVNLSKNGDKVLISVKDTGVGIKEEDKSKLFKAGGVTKDSIKINVKSSGYGLAFVKGVVEAHKGKVWLESEGEGKGSTFFVELPIK